jgi:hypothetical protein
MIYDFHDIGSALFEEPGWYLLPACNGADRRSYIYHVCTQMVTTKFSGRSRNQGQRMWVDEISERHTFVIHHHLNIHLVCYKCELGASDELKGLFLLHNFDWIQAHG